MLDNIIDDFLKNPSNSLATNILRYTISTCQFRLGYIFADYFNILFPNSIDIKEEYAIICYKLEKYEKSYDVFDEILNFKGLPENILERLLFNQHFSIDHVSNRYTYYNKDKVEQIISKERSSLPLITLSITTCKRLDLFVPTMNSFINCIDVELIDEWLCVDDNSSDEDRKKMQELYPFFTFIWKDKSDKGHPRSMNIIKNSVKTPYLFHLEDDWKFFVKKNYIRDCLDVLNTDDKIGQCLINKNYTETSEDISVKGGLFKQTNFGTRYYIHEYVKNDEEKLEWYKKYGNCLSSNYWPHFSLRPSLFRTSIFKEIGEFNENVGHFEMEYAYRYLEKGYISTFFEGIYSLHTGRLTSEKYDVTKINAYKLNNEQQFIKKPLTPVEETSEVDITELGLNIKTYVLNLDRRPDRWENFKKNARELEFLNYERFSAIDGSKLQSTQQLQRIFDGNDYNMQVGAVGCAMSYFKMFTELISSEYDAFLFLEDDIIITNGFDIKFLHLCKQLKNVLWDIVFIGHHIKDTEDLGYKGNKLPEIEKWDVFRSFKNSLGGTIGFMVTKDGARKFLDFVNDTRLINCVDTALQKSANELDVYYCYPHLVFSECFRHNNKDTIDTDIQNDFSSLTIPLIDKVRTELDLLKQQNINIEKYGKELVFEKLNTENEFNCYCLDKDISDLKRFCKKNKIKYYTYDEKVIFIFKTDTEISRYFHIFQKNNIYSVNDCLEYKE